MKNFYVKITLYYMCGIITHATCVEPTAHVILESGVVIRQIGTLVFAKHGVFANFIF